ncbi:MAG: hypothetical protein ACYC3S_15360 [Chloroflexota bacterium]
MDQLPAPRYRRGAVLSYALNRWQTLAVVIIACLGIAGTVLFLDASLPLLVFWLGFGVAGTGAMIVVSFRDAESVDEALLTQADLDQLRDRRLRDKVRRAEAYQRAIRQSVRTTDSPELRSALDIMTREAVDPVGLIFTLARRLEDFRADALLQEDIRRLVAGRQSLSQAEQEQLTNLENLQRLMAEVANAIDAGLAQLGTSYTAVKLARAGGELKSSSVQQSLADLRGQSAQLRDLNASLDEVYAQRDRGGI